MLNRIREIVRNLSDRADSGVVNIIDDLSLYRQNPVIGGVSKLVIASTTYCKVKHAYLVTLPFLLIIASIAICFFGCV